MLNALNSFKNDDSGAVTVDWIVLTAALVGLGLAVMGVVSSRVQDLNSDGSASLADVDSPVSPFAANTFGAAPTTPANE